jgi:signal transduction histidine kinase
MIKWPSARYPVAILSSVCSTLAGLMIQATFGFRYPLIAFYPTIILSAWYGGFWPGMLATGLSTALVEYFWLGPLRAANQVNAGDAFAMTMFVAIGIAISGFCESLHRSWAREHLARTKAEHREQALSESESRLRDALTGERIARAEAEEANKLKDQFLATVSHELRTPLNAILGWSDLLETNRIDSAQRERAIQSIHANARRQAQLVDDLLDIAGMLSGKLHLHVAPVDLHQIVRATVDIVQPLADAKQIEIVLDLPAMPAWLADGARVQQILLNLLSNSVKFTPNEGTITVTVHLAMPSIEIVVSDTGSGIPHEDLASIFRPFYQVDSSTTRAHGGLGLGLSIVKHLVEAHGGSVEVASPAEGRGATFVVRLPFDPPRDSTLASAPSSQAYAGVLADVGARGRDVHPSRH